MTVVNKDLIDTASYVVTCAGYAIGLIGIPLNLFVFVVLCRKKGISVLLKGDFVSIFLKKFLLLFYEEKNLNIYFYNQCFYSAVHVQKVKFFNENKGQNVLKPVKYAILPKISKNVAGTQN